MNLVVFNWTPILLPFVIGWLNYRAFDRSLRILFFFVVYGTVNEVISLILRSGLHLQNTMPVSNLYYMVEFIFLGLFYREVLKEKFHPAIFVMIIFLFEAASIINLLFFQSLYEYPSAMQAISKIVLISFTLLLFYKIMDEARIQNLWKEPLVYINVAVLVYYSGNLFFSVMFNLILEYSRAFSKITTYYFSILNTLFYVLIALGFWRVKSSRKRQLA